MIKIRTAVLRALLILAITGLPIMAYAGGGVNVKVNTNEKRAVISLSEIEASHVTLSIKNEDESVLYYSDFVEDTKDFSKTFDFTVLENGNYVIVVNTDQGTVKQPISIKGSQIRVPKTIEQEEPIFKLHENTLHVYFKNNSKNVIKVKFSDNDGAFYEDSSWREAFVKKYDLSKLPNGSYDVMLSNNYNYYTYSVEL